jgi:hypothetical protein
MVTRGGEELQEQQETGNRKQETGNTVSNIEKRKTAVMLYFGCISDGLMTFGAYIYG